MDGIFTNNLRRALNNLYDLNHLRRSPLCRLFTEGSPFDTSTRLQHVLESAIAALKPNPGMPQGTSAWETYELLSLRYLQQFSQKEVADQIGVSLSQMNRIQQKALETLAAYLWEKYNLADQAIQGENAAVKSAAEDTPIVTADPTKEPAPPEPDPNMAWLAVPSAEKLADLAEHLADVLEIIQPFLAKYAVALDIPSMPGPFEVLVYPTALRQMLLNLLTITIPMMAAGHLHLDIARQENGILLQLDGSTAMSEQMVLSEDTQTNLDIAASLVQLSGGKLDFQSNAHSVKVSLCLPARANLSVLVIDDSQDTLHLLERYTAGTQYRVVSTTDPQQALKLAESSAARVIVVDVMMPRIDGWTLLQRLHNHPITANTPVVICSILRQEELATSLGASAYLRKPVNQAEFLALLDHLTGNVGSELR